MISRPLPPIGSEPTNRARQYVPVRLAKVPEKDKAALPQSTVVEAIEDTADPGTRSRYTLWTTLQSTVMEAIDDMPGLEVPRWWPNNPSNDLPRTRVYRVVDETVGSEQAIPSSTIMEYTNHMQLLSDSWAALAQRIPPGLTGYLQVQDTNLHHHVREVFLENIMYLDPHWWDSLQPLYRHARFAGYQPTSEDDDSSDYSSTMASTSGTTDLDMPALLIATPVVRRRSKSLDGRPRFLAVRRAHNRHRAKSA